MLIFCILMFNHRNAASLGITAKPAWCSALAPLHFCVFAFLWKQVCVPIIYIIINKWFICWFNKVYANLLSILRLQKHKNTKRTVMRQACVWYIRSTKITLKNTENPPFSGAKGWNTKEFFSGKVCHWLNIKKIW